MTDQHFITTQEALEAWLDTHSEASHIGFDTEFIRERTYYPTLCLVQLAADDAVVAIDTMAPELDLTPLWTWLLDDARLLILHAAGQDMELLLYLSGKLPTRIFDTQLAAAFCGLGDQLSYEKLVQKLVKQPINKASQFTDWSHRPLTDNQIAYALDDVRYLSALHDKLTERLEAKGRLNWLWEEGKNITSPETYTNDPEQSWQRIRMKIRDGRSIACLQRLAAWREREAETKNLPRQWVIKDEALAEMAATRPTTEKALKRIRFLKKPLKAPQQEEVFRIIEEVKALPDDALPTPPKRPNELPAPEGLADMLKLLLKHCARQGGIAPRLLASAKDMEQLALRRDRSMPCMQGWRYDLFGQYAESLFEGKLSLTFDLDSQAVKFV